MRPSLRFLGLALFGWAGVRAATLGVLPGAEIFRISPSEAKPVPPIVATEFPPIEPLEPAAPLPPQAAGYAYFAPPAAGLPARPVALPVYYASAPVAARAQSGPLTPIVPIPPPHFYGPITPLDEWPLAHIAAASMPVRRSTVVAPMQSTPVTLQPRLDRLQLSAWTFMHGRQGVVFGPSSLASGGQLGASQAGARLFYNFTRQIAATLRISSDVGRRGGEVATGVRIQPLGGLPLWFTAERRQRLGRFGGGRNDFALLAEAGVYQRPMPWRFQLDAYLQGGGVGLKSRDKFIDGAFTLTRPVYRQFSAGFGMWGGAQPGLYRIDAGPRVTMKVRNNMRVHFDWRQKLAGNAQPGSGPAVTLAGDF